MLATFPLCLLLDAPNSPALVFSRQKYRILVISWTAFLHFLHKFLSFGLLLISSSPSGKLGRKFWSFDASLQSWAFSLPLIYGHICTSSSTQFGAVVSHFKFEAIFPAVTSIHRAWFNEAWMFLNQCRCSIIEFLIRRICLEAVNCHCNFFKYLMLHVPGYLQVCLVSHIQKIPLP